MSTFDQESMENSLHVDLDKNEHRKLSNENPASLNQKKSKDGKKGSRRGQKKVVITLSRIPDGFVFLDSTVQNKKSKSKKKAPTFNGEQQQVYTCYSLNCGKTFSDSAALRKHALTHGEKQYICSYKSCQKKFLDNSKLRRHLLVHTGEKPFKCEFCGKCFGLDFNLRTHLRTHTGEKPYVCSFPDCNKRFTQSSNLSAHEKMHFQNKVVSSNVQDVYQERKPYTRHTPRAISQFQLPQTQQQQASYCNQNQMQPQSNLKNQSNVPVLSFGNPFDASPNMLMFPNEIFSLNYEEFSQGTKAAPYLMSGKDEGKQEDQINTRQDEMTLPSYLYMSSNDNPFQYDHF